MQKHLVFSCPAMQQVAQAIAAGEARIELGTIEWKRFPDSWPNIMINGFPDLSKRDVTFIASFGAPEVVFEQMSVLLALAEGRPRSLKILLPYFPTGTMERVDVEGQVATASTLARLFSALPPSGPGPIPLYLWDVHALPIRHYFGQNIAPRFKTGTKLLKEKLAGKDVSIVFPDEGAWKRFKGMFSDEAGKPLFPFVLCRKVRKGDERVVTVSEGEVLGKDVVIVDDLVHSGGTTRECMKALKEAGAKSVSAYVTHGVMELEAWKKFVGVGFEKVYITDSCPATAAAVKGVEPFEVLSLVRSMTNAVLDG